MNPASVLMWQAKPNMEMIISAYLMGIPFDLIHTGATVVFCIYILSANGKAGENKGEIWTDGTWLNMGKCNDIIVMSRFWLTVWRITTNLSLSQFPFKRS